jgi:peptidoglycan/xylan/chitin deacetylase (PgdA/CDA1 family)
VKSVYHQLARAMSRLNSSAGAMCLRLFPEASGLIVLALHAVLRDWNDPGDGSLNPRYALSIGEIERIITYYLSRDFQAVSPDDIAVGLAPRRRYVMFTFDDGYANNLGVIPVLEKHRVPAVFALVAGHVRCQKAFWWDIVYRQKAALKDDARVTDLNDDALIREKPQALDALLAARFGEDILRAHSDCSRPMKAEEIRELARHPLVFWANHTTEHEYLPNCTPGEVRQSVGQAQETLETLTGSRPISIAYPYGGQNQAVRSICRDLGLRVGLTMASYKQPLDVDWQSDRALAIPRFGIFHDSSLERQCVETRIDWKPSWLVRGRPARSAIY